MRTLIMKGQESCQVNLLKVGFKNISKYNNHAPLMNIGKLRIQHSLNTSVLPQPVAGAELNDIL